ncbi:MAG: hypothetical protein CVT62_07085 [Actinobacteria bacterium HGW-Actinobacteria-2]|nr:MAG: hypothetical protein CVT62_07085 [Actinobacteria bacterium HGW-Actinobacteria-2]
MVRNHVIVDANVAKSAAPGRTGVAKSCYHVAMTLIDGSCQSGVFMTPALREEWRTHASPSMVGWLATMVTRRRVRSESDRRIADFRRLVSNIVDEGIQSAVEKDAHLTEAAIYYHVPVVSQDARQRRYLCDMVGEYPLLGALQWTNPCTDQDWEQWIREGCLDPEPFRLA